MNGDFAAKILERWGFPVLVAMAAGWILRNDVLLPLVDEHRLFVRELSRTQTDIGKAMNDQTRLLIQMEENIQSLTVEGRAPRAQ